MQPVDELTSLINGTANQVVSSLFSFGFRSYQFDYSDLGKTTCIWIDHGPNEPPQLLILHNWYPEHECSMPLPNFSEYKDEFARLRTLTCTLLPLHVLRNKSRGSVHTCYPKILYIVLLISS